MTVPSHKFFYLIGLGWVLSPQGRTPGWYWKCEDGYTLWFQNENDAYARQKEWEAEKSGDLINSPSHYNQSGIEVIDVIEAYAPDSYHLGNVIKYCCRSGHKGQRLQDYRKARWYLDRLIENEEKHEHDTVPGLSKVQGNP